MQSPLNFTNRVIGYVFSNFYNYSKKVTQSIKTFSIFVFDIFYYFFLYLEFLVTRNFEVFHYISFNKLKSRLDRAFFSHIELTHTQSINFDLVLFFSTFIVIFTYIFSFNSSVSFSNEGIWLFLLTIASFYAAIYFKNLEELGKDYLTLEIQKLKQGIEQNTLLSIEVFESELHFMNLQLAVSEILEDVYLYISEFEEDFSENLLHFFLDEEFKSQLKYISILSFQRDTLFELVQFEDLSVELLEEIFEEYK